MTVESALSAYRDGLISRREVVVEFIYLAADEEPSAVLKRVPVEFLDSLREEVSSPPASPDDLISVHGYVPMRYESEAAALAVASKAAAAQRKARQRYFSGSWALHHHFRQGSAK